MTGKHGVEGGSCNCESVLGYESTDYGSTYTDVLRFPLSLRGIRLETPLDGLGLGERLRVLKTWHT